MQAAWMIAASLFFALMSVCIKYPTPHFGPLHILCYRGAIAIVPMWALPHSRGVSLKTSVPMMHVWRNVVGVAALVAWLYAIAHLPLATAMTLNYMSGVWATASLLSFNPHSVHAIFRHRAGPPALCD